MFGPWGAAIGAVGGAAMSIIGGANARNANKAAEAAKKDAQDRLIMENQRRATHDYLRQVRLEQLQETQEQQAVAENSQDFRRAAEASIGASRSDAAERGVAGASVEMIVNDYEFQQDQEIGRLAHNQRVKDAQHGENIAGFQDQFDQRVNAVKPYVPRAQPPVDYFSPVFGAIGTVGEAYDKLNAPPASTAKK